VSSLARPGANVTGLAIMHLELSGKRLEVLTQALPAARRVAFLVNPANPSTVAVRRETEARARALGLSLLTFDVSAPERVEAVLAAVMKAHPDALVVQGDPLFTVAQRKIIDAAAHRQLPAMGEARAWVEAGGFISYGTDVGLLWRRAATYVDRVLKGAKPGDLPVEQPTTFELAINLKTAQTFGMTIPSPVLLRADRVVQ
jgi:putative tryptophan/tyrosine transport system substrate-binding protein